MSQPDQVSTGTPASSASQVIAGASTGQALQNTGNTADEYRSLVYVFNTDSEAAHHLARVLELYQHEVVAFSSLDEFRAAMVVRRPQAAVVDIDSEEGRQARKAFGTRIARIFPVVFISHEDNFEQRLAAVRENADGYFIKPLDVDALSARLDEQIAKNEVHAYRVLIVDDDEHLSAYYEAVLNSEGMHVRVINDPSTVLETMKKFKPELVLVDIYMPVCTGVELAKLIRQNNQYLDIPIVFLSKETDVDRQHRAIESGGDDFLTKPIAPEDLICAVSNRADRYRALRRQRHT
jgi:DNA-binding response OmpR family regulator